MTGVYFLLLGVVFLLSYGIAKLVIISYLQTEKVKAIVHRLSVYVLFIGFWISMVGIGLIFDQLFRGPLWYRMPIRAAFFFFFLVGPLAMVLLWVRTSITLRRRRPLKVVSFLQKDWYIIEVRPDFSKSLKERITWSKGASWEDDVVRVRPHLSQPRQLTPQNHIICLDGTWNDAASDTNVHRFFELLSEPCDSAEPQIARYYKGVGVNENEGLQAEVLGDTVTKGVLSCATGLGERAIRWLAYLDFVATYQPGDRVFIFGFSRGASSARILANYIFEYGIPDWVQAKFLRAALSQGKRLEPDQLRSLAVLGDKKWDVEIKMMGLWDTVAAFGLPSNKFEPFRKLTIPDNVRKVYHLVAIDEQRWEFDATLIKQDKRVEEIWFTGAHTNVGGGSGDSKLSDIALRFMINRASEHGICFKPQAYTIEGDVCGPEWPLWSLWSLWPTKPIHRQIRVTGGEPNAWPWLHKSVFRRMQFVSDYKPPNVEELHDAFICEVRD